MTLLSKKEQKRGQKINNKPDLSWIAVRFGVFISLSAFFQILFYKFMNRIRLDEDSITGRWRRL